MKEARACSAEDVRVRLCFLVKVRKAMGRRVAGGRRIGSMGAALEEEVAGRSAVVG